MPRVKGRNPGGPGDIPDLQTLSFQDRLAIGLGRLKAERGLTNKDLAEQLGVSEAYMSQVTRGMRDVKLSTLDKMQREWNVLIEDLMRVTPDDHGRIAALKAVRHKKSPAETTTS